MNTQTMEYVIAIAEEKSLSRAAERLLVSQPALSRQLARLEKELDTRLFRREHNQMTLTNAGRIYVNGARMILSIHDNAVSEIRSMGVSHRKQITLVYNNALLPGFSRHILPEFHRLHPDILLSTINGNASIAKEYLGNGMADLAAVAIREGTHQLLDYIPLRDDELMLALPADHPQIPYFTEHGVDFSRLEQEQFILNQINSHFHSMERNIFRDHNFTPNVLCEIADLYASFHMVKDHKGLTFLPRSMEGTDEDCTLFSLTPPAVFHIVIAWPRSAVLTRPVRDLTMLLLRHYETGEQAAAPAATFPATSKTAPST